MGKHNYPKERKKRNTNYAMSTKVLTKYGEEKFNDLLSRMGMYLASEFLTKEFGQYVSPYVIRYLRNKLKSGEDYGKIL